MYVEPDGVLFLGDALYEAPGGGYTPERLLPLIDAVRSFGAVRFVEGHGETLLSRAEFDQIIAEATATVA
jgi:glyoxylase-like metal-dependent hydrolase (beta-lactamase superfamily II)